MDLPDRMRKYQKPFQQHLTQRCPAILFLDGRAFHTFTKGFERPFDSIIMKCMEASAMALCGDISTAKLAYGQSDEISILLVDYDNFNTMQWFDGNVAKICSIAASVASLAFNECLYNYINDLAYNSSQELSNGHQKLSLPKEVDEKCKFLIGKLFKPMFDARVFSIPKEDVSNYFLWRRQDAIRNSVSSTAQSNFSHRELCGVNVFDMKKKLLDKGIDWDTMPWRQKEGFYVVKEKFMDEEVERSRWAILDNSPNCSWSAELVNSLIDLVVPANEP